MYIYMLLAKKLMSKTIHNRFDNSSIQHMSCIESIKVELPDRRAQKIKKVKGSNRKTDPSNKDMSKLSFNIVVDFKTRLTSY